MVVSGRDRDFSLCSIKTSSEAHSFSWSTGTGDSIPEGKWSGHKADKSPSI